VQRKVLPEINVTDRPAPLLVGRDPGTNENMVGRPFVGDAGEVLDRTLALAGLRRQDVNLTNRVPWQPPGNDFHKHDPKHVMIGLEELLSLIEELQPSLIIGLGNEACYDLIDGWPGSSIHGAKGALDRRGYFWQRKGLPCPVLSTVHPAAILYQTMPNKMLLEIDMLRARAYLIGDLPITPFPKSRICTHPSQLYELHEQDLVSFDIEVTWGGSKLLCIAFYGEKMESPLVVLERDFEWCLQFLLSDVPKLAHNGQFDTHFLQYKMDVGVRNYAHDTSVLHWAMYPELAGKSETGGEVKGGMTRKSLAFLASQHLNVEWWKEYTEDLNRMAELNGRDVWVTRKLFDIMYPEATEMNVLRQYRTSMDMIPTLNLMQSRGLKINNTLRKARLKALESRQTGLQESSRKSGLQYIEQNGLDGYLVEKQCVCCGGGETARDQCWRCAGFQKKPAKKDWVDWIEEQNVSDEYKYTLRTQLSEMKAPEVGPEWLAPCKTCDGQGKIGTYVFNPMSPSQMGELLFTWLRVPKHLAGRDGINANEETMKKILEWSRG